MTFRTIFKLILFSTNRQNKDKQKFMRNEFELDVDGVACIVIRCIAATENREEALTDLFKRMLGDGDGRWS